MKVAPGIYLHFCNQSKNLSVVILVLNICFPKIYNFWSQVKNLDLNLTLPRNLSTSHSSNIKDKVWTDSAKQLFVRHLFYEDSETIQTMKIETELKTT